MATSFEERLSGPQLRISYATMSLVFGYPNTKGIKVSDYLASQGIHLLRCTLSGFEAVVTVSSNQPAYKTYIQYLPAYMAAFCTKKRTSILSPYHPLLYKALSPLIGNRLPDISVSFPSTPPSEILEVMRSAGCQELTVKGTKIFLIPSPSGDLIRALVSGGAIKTTPAAVNSTNIDSLATLSLVRRLFSNFFYTHQYPAFEDDDHLEYVESHWLMENGDAGKKRQLDKDTEGPRKRARSNRDEEEEEDYVDDEPMGEAEEIVPKGNTIVWAIPPGDIDYAWGDEQQIPRGNGIFVRYIDETQTSNGEKAIHTTIGRYFLGALGSTSESVRIMFDRVRRDLGNLIHTQIGRELAHMAKCIDLGLQAQARIFPVLSGEQYLGCVLLGAGYQIHAYDTTTSPVDELTLRGKVEQAGSHRSALSAIASIVDEDPSSNLHMAVKATPSMIKLRSGLLGCPLTAEQQSQICALAKGLRFRSKSLNVSAENIATCLSLIQNPVLEIPLTHPIHPSMLFEQNRTSLVWSAFGDLAPSCVFHGGPQVDLGTTKDLPKHIGFRMVPLKDALIDIEMIMSKKKFPNCTLNRRSGPFKDRLYTGLDASRIMSALASAAGVTTDKGKKKAQGSGNVEQSIMDDGF